MSEIPLDLFGEMSTADDGERSPLDFYETPGWMTRSLLAHHPIFSPLLDAQHRPRMRPRVLECAAGRGAITRELEKAGCEVIENDLNPVHGRRFQLDMTQRESWLEILDQIGGIDYVITNLPFVIAKRIIEVGLDFPLIAFITVLLKSFDEPTGDKRRPSPDDRGPWLEKHPWTRKINQPRHKFRGAGSPSMASDWFIWEHRRDLSLPPCVVDFNAKER